MDTEQMVKLEAYISFVAIVGAVVVGWLGNPEQGILFALVALYFQNDIKRG